MDGATPAARRRRVVPRSLRVAIGFALGVAALILVGRTIELDALRAALQEVKLPFVGLALLLSLLTLVFKAMRWRWLFYPQGIGLTTRSLAELIAIGQAINYIVPGRFGEVARAYLAGEEAACSKWLVLGTLAAEKLIDLVVLALLVVVLLPFVVLPPALAERVEFVILSALVVALVVVALLGGRDRWLALARRALRIMPQASARRWEERIAATLDGLAALRDPRAAAAIWGWTAVFWATAAITNYMLLLAFGLASPLMAVLLVAVLQGGVAVPSTPGKIGVFQLLCMVALASFGVPEATGFAYGVVVHMLVVGGVTIWASLALWRRSLGLRQLAAASASWE